VGFVGSSEYIGRGVWRIFFFLLNMNFIKQETKDLYFMPQQQRVEESSRLQIKGGDREDATFAATCAIWLAFLLTQLKEQNEKQKAKCKDCKARARIFQGNSMVGPERASMQTFASLSMHTDSKFAALASSSAHQIALASATVGSEYSKGLVHTFTMIPLLDLATTAIVVLSFEIAASTFILIVPGGGADQRFLFTSVGPPSSSGDSKACICSRTLTSRFLI
jgi:hypothetical protein